MAKDRTDTDAGEKSDTAQLWQLFEKRCRRCLPVVQVAEFLGMQPAHVALACIAFAMGFLLFGIGGNLITNLVGYVYPAYESFKALETQSQRMMRTWLTYWIVYSCFSLIEVFVDWILYWLPLYYCVKLVFLAWLMIPSLGGAEIVYKCTIQPVLRQYRKRIDTAIDDAANRVQEATKTVQDGVRTASAVASAMAKDRFVDSEDDKAR